MTAYGASLSAFRERTDIASNDQITAFSPPRFPNKWQFESTPWIVIHCYMSTSCYTALDAMMSVGGTVWVQVEHSGREMVLVIRSSTVMQAFQLNPNAANSAQIHSCHNLVPRTHKLIIFAFIKPQGSRFRHQTMRAMPCHNGTTCSLSQYPAPPKPLSSFPHSGVLLIHTRLLLLGRLLATGVGTTDSALASKCLSKSCTLPPQTPKFSCVNLPNPSN